MKYVKTIKEMKWWYPDWPLSDNVARLFAIIFLPLLVVLLIVGVVVSKGD